MGAHFPGSRGPVRGTGSRLPLLAALACLVAGVGAMSAMALATEPPPGVRPLWSYWSGTVGDLLLPVVVYGLTRACQVLAVTPEPADTVDAGPRDRRRGRSCLVAAGVGAAIGAVSQAAWLADPDPQLNWLLIAPHLFSPAGYYHAGFLVLTSAGVAGTGWEALRRAGRARGTARLRRVLSGHGCSVVLASAGLFVLTVVKDSAPLTDTVSARATVAAVSLAPVALLGVAVWRLGRDATVLLRPLVIACCGVAVASVVL
ncbi:hypothetical protein ACFYWX_13295 [Streptomyces sp. NPDC002888]|uniref:hypothetical protein n=1 Tax=Streptomyces sp. NPDC002888 TaxID=3364668 RepID=UPI0036ACD2E2